MEKSVRNTVWTSAIISVICGILFWLVGLGAIGLILLLIAAGCLLTIIILNKKLQKTYQRSPQAAVIVGYVGFFLMLIYMFVAQLRH